MKHYWIPKPHTDGETGLVVIDRCARVDCKAERMTYPQPMGERFRRYEGGVWAKDRPDCAGGKAQR